VNAYPDGAHLYWQFIPNGFDKPTAYAHVVIHVPGHAVTTRRPNAPCNPDATAGGSAPVPTTPLLPGQLRAWGHGPLQGAVSIPTVQSVVLDIADLKPFQFVEGSVLFPVDAVPLEAFTPSGSGPDVQAGPVTGERGAGPGSAVGGSGKRDQTTAPHDRSRVEGCALAFPVLLAAMLIVAARRDRVPGVPALLPEPPEDIHPVDLAALWCAYHHSLTR